MRSIQYGLAQNLKVVDGEIVGKNNLIAKNNSNNHDMIAQVLLDNVKMADLEHWTTKGNMPTNSGKTFYSTSVNNKIYVAVSPSLYGGNQASMYEYNPLTDTWSSKLSFPEMLLDKFGMDAINGKIYIAGGRLSPYANNSLPNFTFEYDVDLNIYTQKANMPLTKRDVGYTSLNNELYLICGNEIYYQSAGLYPLRKLNTNIKYNPTTNLWTSIADCSTTRWGSNCKSVNGKLYSIAGSYGTESGLGLNEEYDYTTNIWTTKAPMKTPRQYCGIGVLNDNIYLINGETGTPNYLISDINEMYKPLNNTWITKASPSIKREYCTVSKVDDKLYIIGGFDDNYENEFIVEEYVDPSVDNGGGGTGLLNLNHLLSYLLVKND